jgi:hypothetical protein
MEGNVEALRAAWRPSLRVLIDRQGRDDTSHPLLHAAHRLNAEAVRFLLDDCLLSPRQRGTVHPYTSDQLTVAELQAVTPLECVEKMIAHQFSRKSKRRDMLLEVQALLVEADAKMKKMDEDTLRQTGGRNLQSTIEDGLMTPSAAGKWSSLSGNEQSGNLNSSIQVETLQKNDAVENKEGRSSSSQLFMEKKLTLTPLFETNTTSLVSSVDGANSVSVNDIVPNSSSPVILTEVAAAPTRNVTVQSIKQKNQQSHGVSAPSVPLSSISASPPLTGGKRPRGGKGGQKLDLSATTTTPPLQNTNQSLPARKKVVTDTAFKIPTKALSDTIVAPDTSESDYEDESLIRKGQSFETGEWASSISHRALLLVEEMIALSLVQQTLSLKMDNNDLSAASRIVSEQGVGNNNSSDTQPPIVLVVLAPKSLLEKGIRVPKHIPEYALQDGEIACNIHIMTKVFNTPSEMITSAKLAFASGRLREARTLDDSKKDMRKLAKLMSPPHFGISGHIAASATSLISPFSITSQPLHAILNHPSRAPSFFLSTESANDIANNDNHTDVLVSPAELLSGATFIASSVWAQLPSSSSSLSALADVANPPATALLLFLSHNTETSTSLRSKQSNVSIHWGDALPSISSFLPLTVRMVASRMGLEATDFPPEEHTVAMNEALKGHQLMQYATNAIQGAISCLVVSGRQRRGPAYSPPAPISVLAVSRRAKTSNDALSIAAQRIHSALLKSTVRQNSTPSVKEIADGLLMEVRHQWAHALCVALGRATMPSATGEVLVAKSLISNGEQALICREFALGDETSPSNKYEGIVISFSLCPLHT